MGVAVDFLIIIKIKNFLIKLFDSDKKCGINKDAQKHTTYILRPTLDIETMNSIRFIGIIINLVVISITR